jgi:hypothetical protein
MAPDKARLIAAAIVLFVVGVFKTQGSSVFGGSFDAAEGVVVSSPFWKEDSEGVVESGGWFHSVHH